MGGPKNDPKEGGFSVRHETRGERSNLICDISLPYTNLLNSKIYTTEDVKDDVFLLFYVN